MQTFLPLLGFAESARVLDTRRLGKQRLECLQILQTLNKPEYPACPACGCKSAPGGVCTDCRGKVRKTAWYNHPAVRMWRGYEISLASYAWHICAEWKARGFKDTLQERFAFSTFEAIVSPAWVRDEAFQSAHRSNLLRKDPVWYGQFGWSEPNNLPYVWPI